VTSETFMPLSTWEDHLPRGLSNALECRIDVLQPGAFCYDQTSFPWLLQRARLKDVASLKKVPPAVSLGRDGTGAVTSFKKTYSDWVRE